MTSCQMVAGKGELWYNVAYNKAKKGKEGATRVAVAEFSGNYPHNIDPKGRATIPAACREALGE